MRILTYSSCFPSPASSTQGIFVQRRMEAVARHATVEVVHPVARCPILGARGWGGWALPMSQRIGPLGVHHVPFAYVPRLLKRLDGYFYARGVVDDLRRRVREFQPDLLDVHFAWPDGVAAWHLSRWSRLPYCLTLRGTILPRYRIACFRKRLIPALRGAGAIISVSQEMADVAISLGADAKRVHVIPNGVDSQLFAPQDRGAARAALGLPQDRQIVVSVASIKPQKGQFELIEALAMLPQRPLLLLLGPLADAAFGRRLEGLIRQKCLQHDVTFVAPQPPEAVARYLSAADVAALASWNEGCPNVVLEALSCGTPVVASEVGGIPQSVHHQHNGLLTPPRDPKHLAQTLADALARQWSRQAICQSVSQQTWSSVATRVYAVFEDVIAAGRPASITSPP